MSRYTQRLQTAQRISLTYGGISVIALHPWISRDAYRIGYDTFYNAESARAGARARMKNPMRIGR